MYHVCTARKFYVYSRFIGRYVLLRINWRSTRAMGSRGRAARWPWSKHLSLSHHYCTRFDKLALRATSISYSRIPLGSELTNSQTNRTVRVTVCNDIRDCDSTATQLRLKCDSTATQVCLRESRSTWLSMSPKKKWRLQGVKTKRQIPVSPWSSAFVIKIPLINSNQSHSEAFNLIIRKVFVWSFHSNISDIK